MELIFHLYLGTPICSIRSGRSRWSRLWRQLLCRQPKRKAASSLACLVGTPQLLEGRALLTATSLVSFSSLSPTSTTLSTVSNTAHVDFGELRISTANGIRLNPISLSRDYQSITTLALEPDQYVIESEQIRNGQVRLDHVFATIHEPVVAFLSHPATSGPGKTPGLAFASMDNLRITAEGPLVDFWSAPSIQQSKPFHIYEDKWTRLHDYFSIESDWEATLTLEVSKGSFRSTTRETDLPSNQLSINGTAEEINQALDNWSYLSGADYYGIDDLMLTLEAGPWTTVSILPACVWPMPDAPVLAELLPKQQVLQDSTFAYHLSPDAFVDADAADDILITVTNLPAWLEFDAEAGLFSGIPSNSDIGTQSLTVTATDSSGQTTSTSLLIEVLDTNDAPVALFDDYIVSEDEKLTVSSAHGVLANDSDIDGNILTVELVASPIHGALVFESTGAFTYLPDTNYSGPDSFTYIANDGHATTAAITVSLTVAAVNDQPTVPFVDDIVAFTNTLLSVQLPNALDPDSSDAITYSLTTINGSSMPAALVFNPETRVLSGIPSLSDVGEYDLQLIATDLAGRTSAEFFRLRVEISSETVLAAELHRLQSVAQSDDIPVDLSPLKHQRYTIIPSLTVQLNGPQITLKSEPLPHDARFEFGPIREDGSGVFGHVVIDGTSGQGTATIDTHVYPANFAMGISYQGAFVGQGVLYGQNQYGAWNGQLSVASTLPYYVEGLSRVEAANFDFDATNHALHDANDLRGIAWVRAVQQASESYASLGELRTPEFRIQVENGGIILQGSHFPKGFEVALIDRAGPLHGVPSPTEDTSVEAIATVPLLDYDIRIPIPIIPERTVLGIIVRDEISHLQVGPSTSVTIESGRIIFPPALRTIRLDQLAYREGVYQQLLDTADRGRNSAAIDGTRELLGIWSRSDSGDALLSRQELSDELDVLERQRQLLNSEAWIYDSANRVLTVRLPWQADHVDVRLANSALTPFVEELDATGGMLNIKVDDSYQAAVFDIVLTIHNGTYLRTKTVTVRRVENQQIPRDLAGREAAWHQAVSELAAAQSLVELRKTTLEIATAAETQAREASIAVVTELDARESELAALRAQMAAQTTPEAALLDRIELLTGTTTKTKLIERVTFIPSFGMGVSAYGKVFNFSWKDMPDGLAVAICRGGGTYSFTTLSNRAGSVPLAIPYWNDMTSAEIWIIDAGTNQRLVRLWQFVTAANEFLWREYSHPPELTELTFDEEQFRPLPPSVPVLKSQAQNSVFVVWQSRYEIADEARRLFARATETLLSARRFESRARHDLAILASRVRKDIPGISDSSDAAELFPPSTSEDYAATETPLAFWIGKVAENDFSDVDFEVRFHAYLNAVRESSIGEQVFQYVVLDHMNDNLDLGAQVASALQKLKALLQRHLDPSISSSFLNTATEADQLPGGIPSVARFLAVAEVDVATVSNRRPENLAGRSNRKIAIEDWERDLAETIDRHLRLIDQLNTVATHYSSDDNHEQVTRLLAAAQNSVMRLSEEVLEVKTARSDFQSAPWYLLSDATQSSMFSQGDTTSQPRLEYISSSGATITVALQVPIEGSIIEIDFGSSFFSRRIVSYERDTNGFATASVSLNPRTGSGRVWVRQKSLGDGRTVAELSLLWDQQLQSLLPENASKQFEADARLLDDGTASYEELINAATLEEARQDSMAADARDIETVMSQYLGFRNPTVSWQFSNLIMESFAKLGSPYDTWVPEFEPRFWQRHPEWRDDAIHAEVARQRAAGSTFSVDQIYQGILHARNDTMGVLRDWYGIFWGTMEHLTTRAVGMLARVQAGESEAAIRDQFANEVNEWTRGFQLASLRAELGIGVPAANDLLYGVWRAIDNSWPVVAEYKLRDSIAVQSQAYRQSLLDKGWTEGPDGTMQRPTSPQSGSSAESPSDGTTAPQVYLTEADALAFVRAAAKNFKSAKNRGENSDALRGYERALQQSQQTLNLVRAGVKVLTHNALDAMAEAQEREGALLNSHKQTVEYLSRNGLPVPQSRFDQPSETEPAIDEAAQEIGAVLHSLIIDRIHSTLQSPVNLGSGSWRIQQGSQAHTGAEEDAIDLNQYGLSTSDLGEVVRAMAAGTVIYADIPDGRMILRHEIRIPQLARPIVFFTEYGHMQRPRIDLIGQTVASGTRLGAIGQATSDAGHRVTPHLHVNVIYDGDSIDLTSVVKEKWQLTIAPSNGSDREVGGFFDGLLPNNILNTRRVIDSFEKLEKERFSSRESVWREAMHWYNPKLKVPGLDEARVLFDDTTAAARLALGFLQSFDIADGSGHKSTLVRAISQITGIPRARIESTEILNGDPVLRAKKFADLWRDAQYSESVIVGDANHPPALIRSPNQTVSTVVGVHVGVPMTSGQSYTDGDNFVRVRFDFRDARLTSAGSREMIPRYDRGNLHLIDATGQQVRVDAVDPNRQHLIDDFHYQLYADVAIKDLRSIFPNGVIHAPFTLKLALYENHSDRRGMRPSGADLETEMFGLSLRGARWDYAMHLSQLESGTDYPGHLGADYSIADDGRGINARSDRVAVVWDGPDATVKYAGAVGSDNNGGYSSYGTMAVQLEIKFDKPYTFESEFVLATDDAVTQYQSMTTDKVRIIVGHLRPSERVIIEDDAAKRFDLGWRESQDNEVLQYDPDDAAQTTLRRGMVIGYVETTYKPDVPVTDEMKGDLPNALRYGGNSSGDHVHVGIYDASDNGAQDLRWTGVLAEKADGRKMFIRPESFWAIIRSFQ